MTRPDFTPPHGPFDSGPTPPAWSTPPSYPTYAPAANPTPPRTPRRASLVVLAVAGWFVAALVTALWSPVGVLRPAASDPTTVPTAGRAVPGPTPSIGVGRKSAVGAVLPESLHGYPRVHSMDRTTFDILRPDVAFYDIPGHSNNRLGVGVTVGSTDIKKMWEGDTTSEIKKAYGDALCAENKLSRVCQMQLLNGYLTVNSFAGAVPDLETLGALTKEAYDALP